MHKNKQTNTTLPLSHSSSSCLGHARASSALWTTLTFLSVGADAAATALPLLYIPPRISLQTTQNPFTAFQLGITTLPRPSACLSWDAQTLWPPRRWSFERVSSWLWCRFRPWWCSSSAGSRRSSCPSRPALAAGWPSCRWCGPRGRSSSPSRRRAVRRPPDRVRY